ncbi:hypothetical protein [Lysinibacillus sp. NPDC093692]|uniref:hypothetical protein n=1 Tax=Lysinibacillus sp. NPDC093692 TaxID=3390578 RepID=UPI003D07CBA2
MDWQSIVANGGFVVLGAIIGGAGSYFGTRSGIKLQFNNEETRRNNLIDNVLKTLLNDEIKYNISEKVMNSILVGHVRNRSNGNTVDQYSFYSSKCRTTQFDKVENLLLSNLNGDTKKVMDFYRFIKFYDVTSGREINDYPMDASKEFIVAYDYFVEKFNIDNNEK